MSTRKASLAKSSFGPQLDLDKVGNGTGHRQRAAPQLLPAGFRHRKNPARLATLIFRSSNSRSGAQAKAALDQPERISIYTVMRAPMSGVATQVDQIPPGRFVVAGTPVFSASSTLEAWVDANPKESDFTYVAVVGRPVTIQGRCLPGSRLHVNSWLAEPRAMGAHLQSRRRKTPQASPLKVVQRVPVLTYFDQQ